MPLQGAILDCTCSEVFTCMRELTSKVHVPSVVPLTDGRQVAVSKKWLQIHWSREGQGLLLSRELG